VKQVGTHYESFIVKVCTVETAWGVRGWVQHVRSQERAGFVTLEAILDFVKARIGVRSGIELAPGPDSRGDTGGKLVTPARKGDDGPMA